MTAAYCCPFPVCRQCFRNRFMYRLASSALTTPLARSEDALVSLSRDKRSARLCGAIHGRGSGRTSALSSKCLRNRNLQVTENIDAIFYPLKKPAVFFASGQRRALPSLLSPRQSPLPAPLPLFDRNREPSLDQTQYLPIHDSPSNALQQFAVRDRVEVFRQIGIDYIRVACYQVFMYFSDCVLTASLRSVAVGTRLQIRLEDRLQLQLGSGLHHPIPNRRNSEWPFAAPVLWDHHPPHRLRLRCLVP